MRKREQAAPVVCVTGASDSGKTTLIVSLIHEFRARGLRVAALKHASHGFSMDRPGKDTWRLKGAGAREVAVVGGGQVALIADAEAFEAGGAEPEPLALARRLFSGVDLVLAEGFSSSAAPRIEIIADRRKPRARGAGPLLAIVDRSVAPSAAADGPLGTDDSHAIRGRNLKSEEAPVFSADNPAPLAEFLLETLRIDRPPGRNDAAATASARVPAAEPI